MLKVLSNELSQIRKMSKMVDSAKLAFEQIQLRLNTVTELGDVVVTLNPAMSVIKGIQGGLSSMMPQAESVFWTDFRFVRLNHVRVWSNTNC